MKKFLQRVVLVAVAMATAQVAVAESWRINNDPAKGAHFASINDAMASEDVKDGDVLYLDPGCDIAGDQTITKAVTLIGTGWEYTDKPYAPALLSGTLYIKAAATVTGVKISGEVYPQCSNVVIERCLLTGSINTTSDVVAQNVSIISCNIGNGIIGQGAANENTKYWKIFNNYVYRWGDHGISRLYEPEISNNYINLGGQGGFYTHAGYCFFELKSATITYNILNNHHMTYMIHTCTDCYLVYNCMCTSDSYDGNVCLNSNDMTQVFEGGFRLCENSPAANIDGAGNDAGVYAGLYPYQISGMPKYIPYFTNASVPTQPTDGKVKVSLKIVNQND